MYTFPTKTDGVSSEPAAEYNNLTAEIMSVVTSLGMSLNNGSVIQLAQAIAAYAATGNMYSESGSSNTFTCTPSVATRKAPDAYYTGMIVRFNATHGNTGAATINVASLGSKDIKKADGTTALSSGDIVTTGLTELWYDGSVFRLQGSGLGYQSPLTTQGDLLYYGASGLARLAAGAVGSWLRSGGAGANPSWVQNLEVVVGTYTGNGVDNRTITVGFADTSKRPKWVLEQGTTGGHWMFDGQPNGYAPSDASSQANGIKSITTNGFVVGTNAEANQNGTTKYFIAVG